MDTFFENGGKWNVFKSSQLIREKGIEDWRWTKKLHDDDGNMEGLQEQGQGGVGDKARNCF